MRNLNSEVGTLVFLFFFAADIRGRGERPIRPPPPPPPMNPQLAEVSMFFYETLYILI